MPSKGIHVYTYIAVQGISIELSVPKQTELRAQLNQFQSGNLEVETRNITSFFDKKGRFTFKVLKDGTNLLTEQWIDVNAITGNASGGTMDTIASTPAILTPDNSTIITYGFYESGPGHDLLPSRHQCYIAVSPNYTSWMGQLAPPDSPLELKPFSRLVLPSAHDVGMNSMQSSELVLKRLGGAIVSTMVHDSKKMSELANALSAPAINLIAPNIIFSLAITQKDSLPTMLSIGARYFEFRPAHCHQAIVPSNALPDRLYFQHSAIPGMAYESFLNEIVAFLTAHPTEIIVVQLRWDGVPAECARPSDQEQAEYLSAALNPTNNSLLTGNLDDLRNKSIAQLRKDKQRLIMLVNVDSLSTYTDEGNATMNGDTIVNSFPTILTQGNVGGRNFVNVQCQATAANIPKAIVYSVLEAGTTTSCILATKGVCDSKTLPWCRENVVRNCGVEPLVVIMNDFIDGATADVAVQLSRVRLGM